jgi:Zn-dependent M28 family amino/carboxypeptidase
MKRILAALLLLGGCSTTQVAPPPAVTEAELRSTISVLAADEFGGRMSGTPGELKAANYIAERLRVAGVQAAPGGFLQPFAVNAERKPAPADSVKLPAGQRYFLKQMNSRGPFTAYNVVGRVPGHASDDRAVVLMAHYDHLGLCLPEGAADRICNGAVDNASGVAALIAVAERVAEMKLDRDVWFVATSAEEWGLLGAKAFAASPPLPLKTIIAGFNLDTIAIAPRGLPVAIVAAEKSPLGLLVREAAAAMARAFDDDREAASFLQRQDGWALAQRGVPMIMAGGSFSDLKRLNAFLASQYHDPKDELRAETELGGAVEDANLHVELIRRAASRSLLPSFAGVPQVGRR